MGFLAEPVSLEASTSDRFFESLRNTPPPVEDSPTVNPGVPSDSPSLRRTDDGELPRIRPQGPPDRTSDVLLPPINPGVTLDDTRPELPPLKRIEEDPFVRFDTQARELYGSFYFGFRWPGVSVGFRESPYTVEIKHLDDPNNVSITGLRLYHHLLRIESNNLYWGIDFARLSFEGSVSEGEGNSAGLFMGFEKRVMTRITWSLDVGPYFIHLRDDSTNITQDGLEFTMTTGFNIAIF